LLRRDAINRVDQLYYFGELITKVRSGQISKYARMRPVVELKDAKIYQVLCP